MENQVIRLLRHFAVVFSLSSNIITGISNKDSSGKSDQWNYKMRWSVVICDGTARETGIKIHILEQSAYPRWLTVWGSECHSCCHTSNWNLLPTGYRKETAKEIWSLKEWLHLLKAFISNCFISKLWCYGKINFYCNYKSWKFNLIASQPGKKSYIATVITYQKGQQFYFNNIQL